MLCAALALGAWCGWASGFHRRTAPALVTWLVSLAAVVAVNLLLWQGRQGRRPGWRLQLAAEPWPRPPAGTQAALAGTSPWLALALVGIAWDVLGLDTGPHEAHLTISALTQAYRPLNAAMLLVWMLAGAAYGAARARAPAGAGRDRPPGAALVVPPALLLPSDPPLGVAFWLGLVAAGVVLDAVARRTGGRIADAEELLRFVTRPPAGRLLLALAWGFAGYHLFAY